MRVPILLAALAVAHGQTVPATNNTIKTRACQPPYDSFPFCNTSLPLALRVRDLISRLRPEEVAPQLTARHGGGGNPGPGSNVSRLGLPTYDWGMNALHGVQSSCVSDTTGVYCPTSFPNPVNYGMTFNRSLAKAMGAIIGVETRALWLAGAVEANPWSGRPPIGLDAWSPNININRDPRWGRNQEVPSEDPFINGVFGTQYSLGIQGNDPAYLQAVVTLKHFDAYSLEDSDGFTRHNFNAIVSNYALADTYFPAFRMAIMQGNAKGIMCAYNSVNGFPSCASPLFAHVLRTVWGFQGYITSDTGAIEDIYQQHKFVPTEVEAAAVAIRNGTTDICSGAVYHDSLLQALSQGLITYADINAALTNTFTLRFQLGLFDPVANQPYWQVPLAAVNTEASRASSLLAALSSMVLLKNEGGLLPLPKGKRVAVIGPHSTNGGVAAMVGSYLGQLCPDNSFDCIPTITQAINASNTGGATTQAAGCPLNSNSTSGFAAALALAQASDYVILTLGIDGSIEGETEDRTSIDLPAIQHELVAALAVAGKPMVVVVINGGMVDISLEAANPAVRAIIEAGYPGVFGAQAIAATLFGDNDHLGGKLPYTIYPANYTEAITMSQMEMDVGVGRSYRYYEGPVVYPFGYGLAYSTFELQVTGPANITWTTGVTPPSNVTYDVIVKNTGSMTADEVVMAFFAPKDLPLQPNIRLLKQLFGFERVHVSAGLSAVIQFSFSTATLCLVDKETGDTISTPGAYDIIFTNGVDQTVRTSVVLQGPQVVVNKFPY